MQVQILCEQRSRVPPCNRRDHTDLQYAPDMRPLIWSTLLNSWFWIVLLTYGEVTLTVFLPSPDNETRSALVWSYWYAGQYGKVSAVGVLVFAVLAPLAFLYWHFGRGGNGARSRETA
jgi:ABC-type Fe3+ transport system permease subunit